ncbi:MAG TPA: helix-turn-helix transcriptional regulator [Chloroflexota bacterium]|jgi:transcriptional regulator with XRE-family HTH domain|nr:helix-turn-helix transcriptional regulator [Chloroflexota bacterium]
MTEAAAVSGFEAEAVSTPEFAGRIRELRHARNWNQAQLAREAGLSRAYIKALEDGHSKEPSARTIGRLCLAFQTDPIELMQMCGALPPDFREGQFREDLDMVMYLRRQRKLSEAFVNTLMRLIRLAELDERGSSQ